MGLQSQLNDFSSDSLPLFLLSLLASSLSHLRSLLFPRSSPRAASHRCLNLNLNPVLSYRHPHDGSSASDCVVCLSPLSAGDAVSRLPCRHVFHTHCFHACLRHLNFNCPLCRSPISRAAAAASIDPTLRLMPPVPSSS